MRAMFLHELADGLREEVIGVVTEDWQDRSRCSKVRSITMPTETKTLALIAQGVNRVGKVLGVTKMLTT